MKTPSYGETRTQRGCASLQEIQGSCFCLCRTQKESLLPCRRHRPSLAAPRLGEKKLERPRPQEEAGRAAPPSSVSFAHVRGLNLHQDSPRTPGTGPSPRRAAQRRLWVNTGCSIFCSRTSGCASHAPPAPPNPRESQGQASSASPNPLPSHFLQPLSHLPTLTYPVCSLCQLHHVILNPGISRSSLAEDLAGLLLASPRSEHHTRCKLQA